MKPLTSNMIDALLRIRKYGYAQLRSASDDPIIVYATMRALERRGLVNVYRKPLKKRLNRTRITLIARLTVYGEKVAKDLDPAP